MRQASQRTFARSGTTRDSESSRSLTVQESRRRLGPSTHNDATPSSLTENESYGAAASSPSPANHNNKSALFDKLELLGPSLLEVLTLVEPPQPRAQQELDDNQLQQQAGEDTLQGGVIGDPSSNNIGSNGDQTQFQVDSTVKFDPCVSRSAILGKIADASVDNSRETQEYFAKILDKLHVDATGLVLLQESTILIFLETTADQFLVLCRQLLQQRIIDAASLRVLASCDDNAERILQGLYFKKVVVTRQGGNDANGSGEWTDDSLHPLAVDTFLNLIKFAKKIGPMTPAEIRKTLTNLSNSDQMCLPSNDLLLSLLDREEFMGLDEFLYVFDSPIEIELESERVWPVHPLIHY
uniref:Uncharacterized protein n=1 Tax=Globisporangium ultimum (strain ATCC 200006 / CBS 805.95 / DAOM BR144) TaxID=431595 RepID=K3WXI8_GLOUD